MKVFAKTNEMPDNGYQREIYEIEVAEDVYARVMCCLIPEKPYFYLMEEENGATLSDGLGGSLGVAENADEIIGFVRSWVEERQRLAQEVNSLYRFELGFMGEPQDVGLFQGLDDTPIPCSHKDEFYEAVKDLVKPLGLETSDGSDVVFFFTEKGLKAFSEGLNLAIQELNDVDWQMLGMPLVLEGEESCGLTLRDAIYVDEYQVAFSHSDLAEVGQRYAFQEVSAIDTDRVNPLVVLDEYGVDKDKIMESARVSVVWDVDGIWVDFNYSYSAEEGYRDSTLVFCEIYEDGKPDQDVWKKAVRIGEELKDMYNVPLDVARDDLNNLQYIAAEVREKMVGLYGDGTDLCGHCIEASEKIAERIREELGIEAITVEGWCRFDDDAYGSDHPWDPHTWVEVPSLGLYVDVTADQFNFGMEHKNEFPGVIVQKGLPYGMIYDEPQWDVELEDEIKEENSSLESKIQSAESRAAVLRSGTFVLTKDPER